MTISVFFGGHEVDIIDMNMTSFRDFEVSEKFQVEIPALLAPPILSWVRVDEYGETIYRGAVESIEGDGDIKGTVKVNCISIVEVLRNRLTWPMTYGAPAVVGEYRALSISQVLADTPPNQVAGIDQFYPGILWMLHSYMSVSATDRIDGVWRYEGWGQHPRSAGRDVYVGGRLCAEVFDIEDIKNETYQYFRDEDLHVWGAGECDYGPVCIDGAFDSGMRLGNIDRAGDYLLSALTIGIEDGWQLVEDLLFEMGIYIRLRHSGDLTYLDGSINPWGRGSAEGGAFRIEPGEYTNLKRTAPRNITPSAIIGLGTGQDITRTRYSRVNLSYDAGAWIDAVSDVPEGRLSPKGRLDAIIDAQWADASAGDYISLETPIDYFRPGDWLDIEISPSETITAQISEISRGLSPIRKIRLGGRYASPTYAYLEKKQSLAVEAMRIGQAFGAQEDTDNIGPATAGSISWTPTAASYRDTAEILVDLRATEPSDSNQSGLSVTYTLTITNTLYPGGKVIAILPWMPWGRDPIFEGLDITEWCALDGTEETLEIGVTDPSGTLSETIGYTITVRGIGRYGQSPIKTLTPGAQISSTLSGNIYVVQDGHSASLGDDTREGTALWELSNVAAPTYDFKVVLVSEGVREGRIVTGTTFKPFIKTHGVVYYGASRRLHTYWARFEDEWITNPYTGAAWNQAELDDLQVGIYLVVKVRAVSWIYKNEYGYVRARNLKVELR